MAEDEPNFVAGFFLAFFAGMATVLGCLFIPLTQNGRCHPDKATAAALGFAGGVMLWISFVDVLGDEAKEFFEMHFNPEVELNATATGPVKASDGNGELWIRFWIAFFVFVGVGVTMVLDFIVTHFLGEGHAHSHSTKPEGLVDGQASAGNDAHHHEHAAEIPRTESKASQRQPQLLRISMVAMVALSLHNFPEGLATFVDGANGGFTIVIAIALHNIPEGAAIAVPMYGSLGSYPKAIAATAVSGMAQPIGAAVGWIILVLVQASSGIPDFLFGALYSMTAGVMISISIVGLIPEALGLASNNFVMTCILGGFAVMQTSIIALEASGA